MTGNLIESYIVPKDIFIRTRGDSDTTARAVALSALARSCSYFIYEDTTENTLQLEEVNYSGLTI